jgi:bis(5'-nucleosyl)-tetraphosphatase (symmetrical)
LARYAVGDVQGCYVELRALLTRLRFRASRDQVWFVGDLVNRGPRSLDTLRFVRDLGSAARVVLGNHDLHLLAVATGHGRGLRPDDTLDALLGARDRSRLIDWLLRRPLVEHDASSGDLMVHAGLAASWTAAQAVALSREVSARLRSDPTASFAAMYGDEPTRWDDGLRGPARLRFIINAMTRMRFCFADGSLALRNKRGPENATAGTMPWFDVPGRASASVRVIFGHWSTLGLLRRRRLLGLDTGCVWGGRLTAARLDGPARVRSVRCAQSQGAGDD